MGDNNTYNIVEIRDTKIKMLDGITPTFSGMIQELQKNLVIGKVRSR